MKKGKSKRNGGEKPMWEEYRFIRFKPQNSPVHWIVFLEKLEKDGEIYLVACLAIFHLPKDADENYLATQLGKIVARAMKDPMFNT